MLQDRFDSWVVKRAFCLAAILQNELKALVARIYRSFRGPKLDESHSSTRLC